jgi:hypothetical protein
MCPVCMATAALMAASVTSTGGLTAFAMKKFFHAKNGAKIPQKQVKENRS